MQLQIMSKAIVPSHAGLFHEIQLEEQKNSYNWSIYQMIPLEPYR
jgi:hypothetical protein